MTPEPRSAVPVQAAAICLLIAALAWALVPAVPARAGAAIYFYEDAGGVLHITNRPGKDERYKPVALLLERFNTPASRINPLPPSRRKGRDWDRLKGLIEKYSRVNGFDSSLVAAVIEVESAFDPEALSDQGAQGLMQLMPATQGDLGVADPYDPEQSIEAGARYLRSLYDRFGELRLALAAYNAGPEAVARHGGVPPYKETRRYVELVMAVYSQLKGQEAGI